MSTANPPANETRLRSTLTGQQVPHQAPPVVLTGIRTWPAWALVMAGVILVLLLMGSGAGIALSLTQKLPIPAPVVAPADQTVLTLTPGVTMTLVRVPAGVFLMGSVVTDTEGNDDEKPQRKVYLEEYWIGQYEVTNIQYAAFAQATNRERRTSAGEGDNPVTNVSWEDAVAFCQWVSRVTGHQVQLPTEAEWEKAARGTDGRLFPWGNEAPDASRMNYDLLVKHTTPVGHYSPRGDSPYGAADMVGDVWEWTSSLYWPYPYRGHDGREDAQSGDMRALRGGSFVSQRLYARVTTRGDSFPGGWGEVLGFRVSMSPSQPGSPSLGG